MKMQFELEDIRALANTVAEVVIAKLKDNQNAVLVDIDGLAEYLNVPKSWVYEKTRDKNKGSIPRVKVGKYVRFNIHDVLEWLKRQ
jgi:excisionase family DNA binding protein